MIKEKGDCRVKLQACQTQPAPARREAMIKQLVDIKCHKCHKCDAAKTQHQDGVRESLYPPDVPVSVDDAAATLIDDAINAAVDAEGSGDLKKFPSSSPYVKASEWLPHVVANLATAAVLKAWSLNKLQDVGESHLQVKPGPTGTSSKVFVDMQQASEDEDAFILHLPGRLIHSNIGLMMESPYGYECKVAPMDEEKPVHPNSLFLVPSKPMMSVGAARHQSVPGWMARVINLRKGVHIKRGEEQYEEPTLIPAKAVAVEVPPDGMLNRGFAVSIRTLVLNPSYDSKANKPVALSRDPFEEEVAAAVAKLETQRVQAKQAEAKRDQKKRTVVNADDDGELLQITEGMVGHILG